MTSDEEAVLAANEAFYRAFSMRDVARMERIWARAVPVACLHPGWPALFGRAAVIESWQQILSAPTAPAIRCLDEHVVVLGTTAYLICIEVIDSTRLVATNLFVLEEGVWQMVLHQAGPTPPPDGPEPLRRARPGAPSSLH